MKIIKDIIGKKVERRWRIMSKSKIGVYYEVILLGTGYYKCTCFANRSGKLCSHINYIKFHDIQRIQPNVKIS